MQDLIRSTLGTLVVSCMTLLCTQVQECDIQLFNQEIETVSRLHTIGISS